MDLFKMLDSGQDPSHMILRLGSYLSEVLDGRKNKQGKVLS